MKNPKLFIHIGTWKTGSSTIQYHLHLKTPQLASEGIEFLSKDYGNNIVTDNQRFRTMNRIDEDFVLSSKTRLKKTIEVKRTENPGCRFLASSESFSGDPFSGFKNVDMAAGTLKAITEGLGLDVYIIVYLRRQDDFVESMYTQSIHLGASHSFEEFLDSFDEEAFNWEFLLRSYSDCFGKEKMIVRRYHKKYLPEENSLLHDFGRIIGSNVLTGINSTNSRNRGLSRDALEIVRITNESFTRDQQYLLKNLFQEANAKKPFESYSFFTEEGRDEYLDRYRDSNARVANEYFGETDQPLFPPPDRQNVSKHLYPGLSQEAVIVNFARALIEVNERTVKRDRELRKQVRKMFLRRRVRDAFATWLSRYPGLKDKLRDLFR